MNIKNEIESFYKKSILDKHKSLDLWKSWYLGFNGQFHKYSIPTGRGETKQVERLSLKMAKAVAENYANLLVNEKTNVTLKNDVKDCEDNATLQKILDRLSFWDRTNKGIELEYALGCGAGVINIDTTINENTGEIFEDGNWKLHYEFLDSYKVYPLSWKYGECVECAFASFGTFEGHIVYHMLDENGNYVITDVKYEKKTSQSEWHKSNEQMPPLNTRSPIKLFSYIKPNIADNIDLESEAGISIFANAIDTLKSIDSIYDAYYYEFVLGKKRVFASADLNIQDENGHMVNTFDPNDIGVYVLPQDDNGNNKLQFQDGQLRAEAYSKALNDQLSILSYQCGFGKGFFSFGGEGGRPIQTATAIMVMNNDLFRNIHKQELAIDRFITDIVKGLIFASNEWTSDKFSKQYMDEEIIIKFDDSIFEDKESEKETDRKDVQLGTMSKVEYRAKWNGEDDETAKSRLNENFDYLAGNINALLPSLQANIVSPELFVDLVFGENYAKKTELVKYIEENKSKGISVDDLASGGFGFGA